MKPSTSATVRPASAIARARCRPRSRRADARRGARSGSARSRRWPPRLRAVKRATHRATSANAGTATPSPTSSKVTVTRVAEVKWCVDAVDEPADHPQLGLRVEFHVDEHVRHVVGEPGKERIAHHGPRTHGAAALDRFRHEAGGRCSRTRGRRSRAEARTGRRRRSAAARGFPPRRPPNSLPSERLAPATVWTCVPRGAGGGRNRRSLPCDPRCSDRSNGKIATAKVRHFGTLCVSY